MRLRCGSGHPVPLRFSDRTGFVVTRRIPSLIAATALTTTNQMCVSPQEAVPMQRPVYPSKLPRYRWAATALALLLALAMSSVGALAQSTQGSVIGTVKDSKG